MESPDIASIIVILTRDHALAEQIAEDLVRRNPGVEVHVVNNWETLLEHAARIHPDLLVIDGHSRDGIDLRGINANQGLKQCAVVLLNDEDVEVEGAFGDVFTPAIAIEKSGDFVRNIAAVLISSHQSVGTDRRIQETVRHYRDILEASSDGIFVLLGGVLSYVNESFAKAVGRSQNELIGNVTLTDLVCDDDRLMVGEELARLAAIGGKRDLFEATIIRSDKVGHRFEISCQSSVVNGNRALVGVARDVTAIRELQDEIERARQRAAQTERLRALGELAAGVAHDFNNALEAVLGRIQLVREKLRSGKPVEEDLAIMESAARNAAVTVHRVQDFARPAGDDSWHDVDLGEIAKNAVELVRTRVPASVDLSVNIAATPIIRGSAVELHEVFTNILTNALDAVDANDSAKRKQVVLRCFTQDQLAVIEVEDNGSGMSPEIQMRVFEPFFTTKGENGTGLGLSVSHGILRRHDAFVDIDSKPGRGTRFSLAFTPVGLSATATRRIDGSAMSVVVVDDDSSVAELIKDLLEEIGHNVTLIDNQGDTVAFIAKNRVDLLITDLDLPGTSGWQLARSVRHVRPDILVGLVTGWPLGADDKELKSRGVDFVLSKPFSLESLTAALAGLGGD